MIEGVADLYRRTDAIRALSDEALKAALDEAAAVVVETMRAYCHEPSGRLKESIQASSAGGAPKYASMSVGLKSKGTSGGQAAGHSVTITAGNSGFRFAHLFEFGAKPHRIEPKNAQGSLWIHGVGFLPPGVGVDHPGMRARPFFFPGYRAAKRPALRIIAKAVKAAVLKACSA